MLYKQNDVRMIPKISSHASVTKRLPNSGAIHANDSPVFVETETLFMFNVAPVGSGGGVYALRSVIALTGAEFKGNHAARGGGWSSRTCRNVTRCLKMEEEKRVPNANSRNRSVSDGVHSQTVQASLLNSF